MVHTAHTQPYLTTAPESHAADSRNHGHPGRLDCGHDGEKVRRTAHGMGIGHLLDVGSGAEGLVPSRDHDKRHGTVMLGLLESLEYADTHVVAQRVEGRLA